MSKFKKISLEQWVKDYGSEESYEDISLPTRATKGSAGYDFFMPFGEKIPPKGELLIPTGIQWRSEQFLEYRDNGEDGLEEVKDYVLDPTQVLQIYPRSGFGFKYGVHLKNTVGIIDSDYYLSDNEGHILIKLVNPSNEIVSLPKGKAFAQGIISHFITADEQEVENERSGGFGSTDKENKNNG